MANPQSNLDELMKDPKAAGLLKNKALLQSLMQSPDTQRLMELLSQNAGDGLKTAAAKGDTGALLGMVRQVMQSSEGARLVQNIRRCPRRRSRHFGGRGRETWPNSRRNSTRSSAIPRPWARSLPSRRR